MLDDLFRPLDQLDMGCESPGATSGLEFTLSASCSRAWNGLRSGGANLRRVLLSGIANGNDGCDRPEDRGYAE